MGRSTEARAYFDRVFEVRSSVLGDEHEDTLQSMNNIGRILADLGKYAEAEPYYRRTLEGRRRVLGNEHAIRSLRSTIWVLF